MSIFNKFKIFSGKLAIVQITSKDVTAFKMHFLSEKTNKFPTIIFLSTGIVTSKDSTGANFWITDENEFHQKIINPREKESDEKLPDSRQDTIYGDLKLLAKSVSRNIEHHKDGVFSKIKLRAESVMIRSDLDIDPNKKVSVYFKQDHDLIFNKVDPSDFEVKLFREFDAELKRILKLIMVVVIGIILIVFTYAALVMRLV